MFYKFVLTGEYEDWGCGLSQPENVYVFASDAFALRADGDLSQVQNSTITITELAGDDLAAFKSEEGIAEDWAPPTMAEEAGL